jgi:hypothetical protein
MKVRRQVLLSKSARAARLTFAASALCVLSGATHAQFFSIDHRGPNIGMPGPLPKTAGDILTPAPPAPAYGPPALPMPVVAIPAGVAPFPGLGLVTAPGCIGAPPGALCPIEVDAISNGMDFAPVAAPGSPLAGTWVFSVDEWAVGFPGSPLAPNVFSESPCADEAADVFEALNIPGGPIPPFPMLAVQPGNSGLLDGNGFPNPCGGRYPGLGLIEPRPPLAGFGARPGDNLDALEMDPPAAIGVWFSLDGAFLDPCYGTPNLGSAVANGFPPGAVLFSPPGGPPVMWYPPLVLGLDLVAGPMTDDLDALVLFEDGVPGLTPGDYVRFSVRRGSAVVGIPDSLFGAPIEPGDILMPPPVPGMPPAIFIPAERLGLATVRSGTAFVCAGGPTGDDLDALDTRMVPATGLGFCFGDGLGTPCPCGNSGGNGRGCANSIFPAGSVLTATGSASIALDTVVLTASSMSGGISVFFQGTGQASLPLDDGLFCLTGALIRVGTYGIVGGASSNPPVAGVPLHTKGALVLPGGTRFYQVVYRNAAPAFCPPATLNRTNGLAVVWTP